MRRSESKIDKANRRKVYWRDWRRNEESIDVNEEVEE